MSSFFIFSLILLALHETKADEVACKKIDIFYYKNFGIGSPRTCFMNHVTAIGSPMFRISSPKDDRVEGLYFWKNKKIRFLPEKVAERFPHLLMYAAWECSLTEISKSNFRSLARLTFLGLSQNQIEKIAGNTFEDLASLEHLFLSRKRLLFRVLLPA